MDDIINLDPEGLASWFASADLFQEACKLGAIAPREDEEDAAELENFAMEDTVLENNEVATTHPSIITFIKRQGIDGHVFVAPRFVPDILLPYLGNVFQEMTSMTLDKLLGSTVVDSKKAYNFDADPDTHTLLMFLEDILNQRKNDEISSDSIIEHSARSLAMLHYASRVVESGNTLPRTNSSANVSPSAVSARVQQQLRRQSSVSGGGAGGLPDSLPASLPQSPKHQKSLSGLVAAAQSTTSNNNADNNDNNAADYATPAHDLNNRHSSTVFMNEDEDLDIPPMMIGGSSISSSSAFQQKTPALPKQEPLSGSRRQVNRRWQDWRDSGKKAFEENNLPVSINGVFMTPLGCLAEALEEFLIATGGGVAARDPATIATTSNSVLSPSIGTNSNNTRQLNLNFDDDNDNSNTNTNTTTQQQENNDTQLEGEELAKAEAELWSLLSRAMPLGKSAVTINGKMHTKESAMARAVQADTMSADLWLELARVLPSETGKKRISKSKKHSSNGNKKSGNSSGSNSSPRRRNFGNLLGGGTPASAKRKFNLTFDDFASPAAATVTSDGDFSLSSRSQRTRETPPMVDGRIMTRVHAYAECLKLFDPTLSSAKTAEIWSELGLHMPLNPPNDSVFINNSSYTSRRCHETALELDQSLADSWLDLGWQLLEDKKSTAINGRVFNATDCFREALIRVPSDLGEAWSLLAQSLPDNAAEKVEVSGETYTKIECYRQALKLDPRCISAWIGLGRMLPRGSTTVVNGKEFSQLGLFYHALEMDDSDAVAWNGLGAMLGPVDKAVFRGEALTRRQCYLKALECDPYLARVWNNLGLDLGDPRVDRNDENHLGGRTIDTDYVHVGGKKYDSKAAFIRALHCEGGNVSTSWVNLGMLLAPKADDEGGTAIVCGKSVDKKRCYYEAVRANERNAIAWNNLGAVMGHDEKVVVHKVEKDKLECYRHALENDESLSNAWYNVVCVILNKEKDMARNGKYEKIRFRVKGVEYKKIQCMVNATETNPENGNAWKMLSQMMEEEGVKEFPKPNGGVVTIKECRKMLEKYPVKE